MKDEFLVFFFLLVLFSRTVQPKQIIEKRGHQSKRQKIIRKPIKPSLTSRNKKHDILTLAAPTRIGSLLPSANHMTLMPNGVPTAVGEYVHHFMHRHPLNIPVYNGYHLRDVYPIHFPQHYGPLDTIRHRLYYQHGPWRGLGFRLGYPSIHGFVHGPWHRSLRHGLRYGYHSRFSHGLWHGLHAGHVPAGYGLHHGYGYKYHGYGNWGFQPLRRWFPFSFDHSVDLRGDSGPDTMFVERSSIPAAGFKRPKLVPKVNTRQLLKIRGKSTLTEQVHSVPPLSSSNLRQPLRRKLVPLGLRIQRFKISLAPLKKMLKRSMAYRNFLTLEYKKDKARRSAQSSDKNKKAK